MNPYFKKWLTPRGAAIFFVAAMLLVFPLYLNNRLFNVVDAKYVFFVLHVCFYGLLALLFTVLQKIVYKRRLAACGANLAVQLPEISVVVFLVFSAVAWLFSPYPNTAFWGLPARYNGLLLVLCCALAYALVKIWFDRRVVTVLLRGLAATSGLVYFLAVANHFGADPLHVFVAIKSQDRHMFISTIGNINFLASYIALSLPFILSGFLAASRKASFVFYTFFALLGFGALIAANSDSGYFALAAYLLVYPMLPGFNAGKLQRYTGLLTMFFACAFMFGVIERSTLGKSHSLRGLSLLLSGVGLSVAGLLLFGGLSGLLWGLLHRGRIKQGVPLHQYARYGVVFLMVAGIVILFAANTGLLALPSPLAKFMVFDDRWGSNRGYVWGRLWYVYLHEFSAGQKLFGTGLDTIGFHINPHYTRYIVALNHSTFDSAHNEYLQYLLGIGAFGLLAYLAVLASHLKGLFKEGESAVQTSLRLAVFCYAVQAVFNISMPVVFPLLFVLLGLSRSLPAPAEFSLAASGELRSGKWKGFYVAVCFIVLELFLLAFADVILQALPAFYQAIQEASLWVPQGGI